MISFLFFVLFSTASAAFLIRMPTRDPRPLNDFKKPPLCQRLAALASLDKPGKMSFLRKQALRAFRAGIEACGYRECLVETGSITLCLVRHPLIAKMRQKSLRNREDLRALFSFTTGWPVSWYCLLAIKYSGQKLEVKCQNFGCLNLSCLLFCNFCQFDKSWHFLEEDFAFVCVFLLSHGEGRAWPSFEVFDTCSFFLFCNEYFA